MSIGQSLRRLFSSRRSISRRLARPSRWDRSRLTVDLLEHRDVPATITVTGISDANAVDGAVSLREAILSINAGGDINADIAGNVTGTYGDNDTIIFSGLFGSPQTIAVNGQMLISSPLSIVGPGSNLLTLQNVAAASGTARHFDITTGGTVKISGMKLTAGNLTAGAGNVGGAIRSATGELELTGVSFENNAVVGQATTSPGGAAGGGAIALTGLGAKLTVNNSVFSGNTATGSATTSAGTGGAIVAMSNTSVTINNSTFTGNGGRLAGGVIQVTATSTVTINGSTFTSNSSSSTGGVINVVATTAVGSSVSIGSSSFTSNSGTTGGALNILGSTSTVTLTGNTFTSNSGSAGGFLSIGATSVTLNSSGNKYESNSSTGAAGAINTTSAAGAQLGFTSDTFTTNTSGTTGGAITIGSAATVTFTNSLLTSNAATGTGGFMQIGSASSVTFSNSTVTMNSSATATLGGGVIYNSLSGSTINVNNSNVSNNSASIGGAFFLSGTANLTITGSTLSNNIASGSSTSSGGGAINTSSASTITINNSTLSGNSASNSGGAIRVASNVPLTITNSTFSGNTASGSATGTQGGGAIFLNDSSIKLNLSNSTVVNNVAEGTGLGGGILRVSATSGQGFNLITSSIIAANTAGGLGQDMRFNAGAIGLDGGANLVGSADDGNFGLAATAGPNFTGTRFNPLNPMLAPLANNGGATQTHGLLIGSKAIGAGNQNGNATDQTGAARPLVAPSIGAVEVVVKAPSAELVSVPAPTVGSSTYAVQVVYRDDKGINLGTINSGNVTITGPTALAPSGAPGISGSGTSVTVTYNFTAPGGTWGLEDNGAYTVAVSGGQVFDTDTPTPLSVPAQSLGGFRAEFANVYIVDNNLTDTDDGNYATGELTLREAIKLSNENNTGFADRIEFAAALNGQTITLNTELGITDPVTIVGNGQSNTTIAGAGTNRLFNFTITGAALTLPSVFSNLSLTNGKLTASGNGGTVLLTANTLELNNVAISNSTVTSGSGGAISLTSGSVKLTNTVITGSSASGFGGAITNGTGKIELIGSMLSGNVANSSGGGINTSSGLISLLNSAVTENLANGSTTATGGGGIMSTSGSTIVIVNSTLAKNTATSGRGGAILSVTSGANITLYNSTVAGNSAGELGGGIVGNITSTSVNPFYLDVRSSIVAGNLAPTNPDHHQQVFTAGVYNITINESVIGNGSMLFSDLGNVTGTIDPGLAPLGFYGGLTKSMGLIPGSPALDFGANPLGLTTDQRGAGFPRVVGAKIDAGAFEGLAPVPVGVATLNPPIGGSAIYEAVVVFTSGNASINLSSIGIADVLLSGGSYVGSVSPSIPPVVSGSGGSVTVTYTFPAPTGVWDTTDNGTYTLSLVGNQVFDTNGVAAFAASLGVFTADFPTTFVVDKLGDEDNGNYGVGDLTLREAIKLANAFSSADTITFDPALNNSTITLDFGQLTINQSVVIQGNVGGNLTILAGNGMDTASPARVFNVGISGTKGQVSFSNLELIGGNVTTTTGGAAILNADESVTLTNMKLTGNVAGSGFGQGGAIASSGSGAFVTINSSTLSFNQATGGGGAVYFSSAGSIVINQSKFESNTAGTGGSNGGGAIYSQAALDVTIGASTFTSNTTSANWGGAIAITGATNMSITGSKFESNATNGSGGGGAIYTSTGLSDSTVTISDSTFSMNFANAGGAGALLVSSNNTTLTISNTSFTDNTANAGSGGAITLSGAGGVNISRSIFTNNRAATFGGALNFASSPGVLIEDSYIGGNTVSGSSAEGGGIFISGGNLTVRSSGITNNAALSNGSFGGSGGGISSSLANITIANSTLSGNTAYADDSGSNNPGGGAIAQRGIIFSGVSLSIFNSTLTNNTAANSATSAVSRGGAILMASPSPGLIIESSIIAGNVNDGFGRDIHIVSGGSPITGDNNLIGVADTLNFTGMDNLLGNLAAPLNPGLFPLSFNGGISPTHPLWYNSIALDAGVNNQFFTYDQRGGDDTGPLADFPRVVGAKPDIGAFEGWLDVSPFVSEVTGIVDISSSSATPYQFTVTYDGFLGIDSLSVGTGDIKLTLPDGSTVVPTLVSKTVSGNEVQATYSFVPPGGAWDPTDNGNYVISLNDTEVADKASPTPKTVPGQVLGTFKSSIVGTFVVDRADIDFDDGNYGVGQLTLREAVKLSNFSLGGRDTITFNLPSGTTITLAGSALEITDPVEINGPGSANLTVSGNNSSRIFEFKVLGAGGDSTISGLTLTAGQALTGSGGAINVDNDRLTINNVVFLANTASAGAGGAISVGTAILTINNSVFTNNSASGNGGAIVSTASSGTSGVEITGSTFTGNQGATGGAIGMPNTSSNALTISDSKFLNNTATASGGALGLTTSPATITRSTLAGNVALSNSAGGGAISSNTSVITIIESTLSGNSATGTNGSGGAWRLGGAGTITLTNSTVSGNSASTTGGAFHFSSAGTVTNPITVNIKNSTVTNNTAGTNGAAIFTAGTSAGTQPSITLNSSIVGGNFSASIADVWSALDEMTATVTLTVEAVNSIVGANGHAKVNVNASGTTLVGTTGTPIDAKLAPLANNGGPTETHALLAGSPAINTGANPDGLTTDQRGKARVFGGTADMGAYEVETSAKVLSVVLNDASAQRSRVTSLTVTFDSPVTISDLSKAFTLVRFNDSAPVTLNVVLDGTSTIATITFTGGAVEGASLADGRYTLTAVAAQFTGSGLDGDGNGTPGDNFVLASTPYVDPMTPATGVFRLFGDATGDGLVDPADFLAFRLAFLSSNPIFDADESGTVDPNDFLRFRLNFLKQV